MWIYVKRSVIVGLFTLFYAFSQDESLVVTFGELEDLAIRHSPSIRIIEGDYSLTETARKIDLQWQNPGFTYSQEMADNQLEQYMTLNKEIELPWVYKERQRSWDARLDAAGYEKASLFRQFISRVKSGYCELKLLNMQLQHLRRLKDSIAEIYHVAENQYIEGSLSGIEKNMIQLTLFNIDARLQETERQAQSIRNDWKALMGLNPSTDIQLTTKIRFKPVVLESIDHYLSAAAHTPGYQRREKEIEALESRIKMEQKRLIPNVSLFGGSKQVESSRGFVAGVSIPLPLFNHNQAVIQRQKVELRLAGNELVRYRHNLTAGIKTTVSNIGDIQSWLDNVDASLVEDPNRITSLMTAYREGWISLTELLTAVQIYADSDQKYYRQLIVYYRNVFHLEAITGQIFVNF